MEKLTFTEPIDFVYTWVDGKKNDVLNLQKFPSDKRGGFNRFRNNWEIVESIESVRRFAPFVRKIFIITADGQIPDWYTSSDYPDLELIQHSEIFREYAHLLPVFNSHAIEAMVPRIPGLAEHFVYFNDDMFLGASVQPTDLFTPDGNAVLRISTTVEPAWQTHSKAWRVYRGNLYVELQKIFPNMVIYDTAHQARVLLKSSCLNAWNDRSMKKLLVEAATSKFRSLSDIPPIELFSNIIVKEKKANLVHNPGLMLQIFDRTVLKPEFYALNLIRPTYYCINDEMIDPAPNHLEKLAYYLSHNLPHHQLPGAMFVNFRVGIFVKFISHCISWVNRMLGKV